MNTIPDRLASSKRLTVVTTTFGAARHLEAFCDGVESLEGLDQIELCMVMNEPDHDEIRLIEDRAGRFPDLYRIMRVPQESIGASLNRGLLCATTEYCAFLDVDDTRVPDSFLRQMAVLDAEPDADFTYGDFRVVLAQGSADGRLIETPEFDPKEFSRSCIASPTQLMRRSLIDRIGCFDEQFLSGGDYEFQIRAALGCTFVRTPGVIIYKTDCTGSASSGRLQPLERTAIELRYGLYDKTVMLGGYPFVEEARRYRLDSVLVGGVWHDIHEYVPRYDLMLEARTEALRELEARLTRWRRYRGVREPLARVKGALLGASRGVRDSVRGAMRKEGQE